LRRAFIGCVVVYFPGVFLIASATSLAGARTGPTATIALSIVCVALLLLVVELPILAVARSPERILPRLKRITDATKAGQRHWSHRQRSSPGRTC
jgi:hypothetical protein